MGEMSMPHKLTITGKPTSKLRKKGEIYSFDMIEGSSPSAPKGLPVSKPISYTIFLNKKQFTKAGIDEKNIQNVKLLVQGEPTLDIPLDQCPGEIGVICFQISIVPEKPQSTKKEDPAVQGIKQAVEQIAVTSEPMVILPEGAEDMVPFESVIVPKEFLQFKPNPQKTQMAIDFVKEHGHLDELITINKKTKALVDGYRRYIVAQQLKMTHVPVIYQK
jgi:hypothetical protein